MADKFTATVMAGPTAVPQHCDVCGKPLPSLRYHTSDGRKICHPCAKAEDDPPPMTDTIDVAALVEMVLGRIGSTYDDEAHLSGDEARHIATALQSQADALAEAKALIKEMHDKHGATIARANAAEAALEFGVFSPWLRDWCKRRFGKWITHNTAKSALAELRARRALGGSNAE